ncbi:MAG: hypothetical protein QNK26_00120 [Moritella sp.]|uniref:hypothetical protein n=1 Tax=Moritella sp. TaxID=78556 RepID=UPI0029ABBA51|nr:hypothetical protein [Moritella sp.]MDX2318988.1 hypothetical protein [Moritella sp.]
MSKVVLAICLCLSLQGCSGGFNGVKDDSSSTIGKKADEKEQEKNGLLAIGEFMAVMAVLKTQVN